MSNKPAPKGAPEAPAEEPTAEAPTKKGPVIEDHTDGPAADHDDGPYSRKPKVERTTVGTRTITNYV